MSQSVFGTLYLHLNCATVPLIVTRPMMGTMPFFSLLPFTYNSTLNVLLAILDFLFAKLLLNELDLDKQIGAEQRNYCRER